MVIQARSAERARDEAAVQLAAAMKHTVTIVARRLRAGVIK